MSQNDNDNSLCLSKTTLGNSVFYYFCFSFSSSFEFCFFLSLRRLSLRKCVFYRSIEWVVRTSYSNIREARSTDWISPKLWWKILFVCMFLYCVLHVTKTKRPFHFWFNTYDGDKSTNLTEMHEYVSRQSISDFYFYDATFAYTQTTTSVRFE